jgi:hypothetical protein
VAHAFHGDVLEAYPRAEGQLDQQRQLVRRIDAVDVVRRVCLRQPLALGFLQYHVELAALLRHGAEDVVRGAVDDAVDGAVVIGRQSLLQRADDRNAAADAGFVPDIDTSFLCCTEDFRAVHGEQRLVRRHYALAVGNAAQHKTPRRLVAAHQFDDDVDRRIVEQCRSVVGQDATIDLDAAIGA